MSNREYASASPEWASAYWGVPFNRSLELFDGGPKALTRSLVPEVAAPQIGFARFSALRCLSHELRLLVP